MNAREAAARLGWAADVLAGVNAEEVPEVDDKLRAELIEAINDGYRTLVRLDDIIAKPGRPVR